MIRHTMDGGSNKIWHVMEPDGARQLQLRLR